MNIADGEIAVQRLADGHGLIAQVAAGEADVQALVQANLKFQFHPMWPARQRTQRLRTAELQYAGVALAALLCQLPVQASYQAVEGRFGLAPVRRLHVFGIAFQITEPGPADRYATAHRLALLEGRFFAEPDDRRRIALTVAEHLRALFGDQQFVVTAADAPAGKLVYFDALDINGHGWSRGWLGCVSDNSRRTGFPRRVDVAFHIHRGSDRWGATWWIASRWDARWMATPWSATRWIATRWIGEARSTHRSRGSAALAGIHPQPALQQLEALHEDEGDDQVDQAGGEEHFRVQVGAGGDLARHAGQLQQGDGAGQGAGLEHQDHFVAVGRQADARGARQDDVP